MLRACSQPSIFSLELKPAHRGSREIWSRVQKGLTKGEGRRGVRKIEGLYTSFRKSEFSISPETENSHWSNVGKPDFTLVTINYCGSWVISHLRINMCWIVSHYFIVDWRTATSSCPSAWFKRCGGSPDDWIWKEHNLSAVRDLEINADKRQSGVVLVPIAFQLKSIFDDQIDRMKKAGIPSVLLSLVDWGHRPSCGPQYFHWSRHTPFPPEILKFHSGRAPVNPAVVWWTSRFWLSSFLHRFFWRLTFPVK